jgi:polysaccharide biosynthesis/export protein
LKTLSFTFLTLILAVAVSAQTLQKRPTETIVIGPGDLLHVLVFDTPEMDQHPRVTDGGDIPLYFVGDIHVGGMSPEEAALAVEDALKQKQLMKRPQVTVLIESYATQAVFVMGQVKNPGSYQIITPRPVMDLLSMAGGITDVADRHIVIERRGTKEKVRYFLSNSADEAFDQSVLVYPGDKLLVSKAGVAYALGDVGKPGGFVMQNNKSQLTVLQMVALAGGTPPSATPSHARLIRRDGDGYKNIPIQLSDMQKGKIPDILLQPDDIVYVPFNYLKNVAANASSIVASAAGASIYAAY